MEREKKQIYRVLVKVLLGCFWLMFQFVSVEYVRYSYGIHAVFTQCCAIQSSPFLGLVVVKRLGIAE